MSATLTPLVNTDKFSNPEDLGNFLLNGPVPAPWAATAFTLIVRYLKTRLEANTSVTAEEAFGGASISVGGRIIEFAQSGGVNIDNTGVEQPVARLNPLAVVAYLANGVSARVKNLAEHFNVSEAEILEIINEKDSGLFVGAAGWVKISES